MRCSQFAKYNDTDEMYQKMSLEKYRMYVCLLLKLLLKDSVNAFQPKFQEKRSR